MMNHAFNRNIAAVAAIVLASTATGRAVTLDFNSLAHGEFVSAQFHATHGVIISGVNRGGGPDVVLGFDTTRTGTADPDLEDPWDRGNLAPFTNLGALLIIPENAQDQNGDGLVDSPNDEGARPAGSINFDFDTPIVSFGLDLVDVEGPQEFGQDSGYFATFYGGGVELARVGFGSLVDPGSSYFDASIVFGDNSANRIAPITAAQLGVSAFDRVEINFGGSGGIDNVRFDRVPPPVTTAIPEPAVAWTLMLGIAGIVWFAARRRAQAQ